MYRRDIEGLPVPQFTADDLLTPDDDLDDWTFTASMVSTCEPLLDDCDDNYDVVRRLRKAGVITAECDEDSESCQMFVSFRSRLAALDFLSRLNTYLARKAKLLAEAASF